MKKADRHFIFSSFAGKSGIMFMMRSGFFYLLLSFLIFACDKINIFPRSYVATVNGSKIYLDDYQDRIDKKLRLVPENLLNRPDYMKKFEQEILDSMITDKIMYLRAEELGISVSDSELEDKIKEIKKDYGEDFTGLFTQSNIDYGKWKEEFKNELLLQKLVEKDVNARIKISDEEIGAYFEKHRRQYKSEARVKISQIVVRDMRTAEKAIQRLQSGEAFAKVASDLSISPEASRGGELGFVTRFVMPEPLDETIFELPVNKVSPIVQSSYGFHIFKVLENLPAKDRELSEVREDVIADIRMQKEEAAYVIWLEGLRKKAVITKEKNITLKTYHK
jgi:parvulin-like peptidyl-prolyl isomerase